MSSPEDPAAGTPPPAPVDASELDGGEGVEVNLDPTDVGRRAVHSAPKDAPPPTPTAGPAAEPASWEKETTAPGGTEEPDFVLAVKRSADLSTQRASELEGPRFIDITGAKSRKRRAMRLRKRKRTSERKKREQQLTDRQKSLEAMLASAKKAEEARRLWPANLPNQEGAKELLTDSVRPDKRYRAWIDDFRASLKESERTVLFSPEPPPPLAPLQDALVMHWRLSVARLTKPSLRGQIDAPALQIFADEAARIEDALVIPEFADDDTADSFRSHQESLRRISMEVSDLPAEVKATGSGMLHGGGAKASAPAAGPLPKHSAPRASAGALSAKPSAPAPGLELGRDGSPSPVQWTHWIFLAVSAALALAYHGYRSAHRPEPVSNAVDGVPAGLVAVKSTGSDAIFFFRDVSAPEPAGAGEVLDRLAESLGSRAASISTQEFVILPKEVAANAALYRESLGQKMVQDAESRAAEAAEKRNAEKLKEAPP